MNVKVETEGDVVVVRPMGKMDAITAPPMQDAIDEVLAENPAHVILDLSEVPYVSSAGLRVFLRVAKAAKGTSSLAVCHLHENVRQVFELAGFDKIMTLCDDLAAAKACP